MRRGQAFETMMLVISVIVALAILAVLMNIIGGIGGIGQGDPDKLMNDKLKNVVTQGYGCTPPTKAVIKRGTTIFAKQIRGDIVSIQDTDKIEVKADAGSKITGFSSTDFSSASAKIGTSAMTSAEAQISFVVCGDATNGKYRICIAQKETVDPVKTCSPP